MWVLTLSCSPVMKDLEAFTEFHALHIHQNKGLWSKCLQVQCKMEESWMAYFTARVSKYCSVWNNFFGVTHQAQTLRILFLASCIVLVSCDITADFLDGTISEFFFIILSISVFLTIVMSLSLLVLYHTGMHTWIACWGFVYCLRFRIVRGRRCSAGSIPAPLSSTTTTLRRTLTEDSRG